MNDKHTPGPWRIAPASDYLSGKINIDAGERGQAGYICEVGMRDDPIAVADALLIVAAPDLLAAAQAVLAGLNARIDQATTHSEPVPVFDGIAALHDAVAKATRLPQ